MALVGDPELLFLDEPTTGFDPSARHQAWSVISRLRTLGKTIVLTTHYTGGSRTDRRNPMNDARLVWHEFHYERRAFLRDSQA